MVSGTQPPVPVKSSCSRPAIKPSHWWSQPEASDQPLWLAEGKAGEASLVSGWRGQGSQLGGGGPGGSGQWPGGGSQLASWRPRARTSLVKICSIKGKKWFLRFIDNGLILSNPGKYKICNVEGSLLQPKAVICWELSRVVWISSFWAEISMFINVCFQKEKEDARPGEERGGSLSSLRRQGEIFSFFLSLVTISVQ